MGDILNPYIYGSLNTKSSLGSFSIQWHITAECDQMCKHCYMFESDTYQSEKSNPLNLEESYLLIDQYDQILSKLGVFGSLHITGGDPILSPNFWEILEYIATKNTITVALMGNPYHINDEVAQRLKKLKVRGYQISIDGMEETHDFFRRKGSFKDSIRAFESLNRNGITTSAMFTLSKRNHKELIEVYKYLAQYDFINSFTFDRLVPMGAGNNLVKDGMLTPEEHREILYQLYLYETSIDTPLRLGRKDELWKLLLYQMGLLRPISKEDNGICQGCSIPYNLLSVLADGTIYSCRRLGITIGKFPEDHLWDIFCHSPLLNQFREKSSYEKCNQCELFNYCRACAAVKYGFSGDPFKADPHCWKSNHFVKEVK